MTKRLFACMIVAVMASLGVVSQAQPSDRGQAASTTGSTLGAELRNIRIGKHRGRRARRPSSLFSSKPRKAQRELLILITPRIVRPVE